jgi:uncharacterized protein (TIGR03545 family)
MIRKSGWLVFLVLLAAILALVYLFAGFAIRLGMVYTLEKAVGAEVNIDRVSLSLAPLALNIRDLQITDKDKPTHNTLSFAQAQAALEVWPALLGYYVVNDLSIDGLAYGAERRSPGKVYRGENATEQKEPIDIAKMLNVDLPDAKELLARVNLQIQEKGRVLQQLLPEHQQQLDQMKTQLPTKEKLEAIQAQIKTLTDSKIADAADLAKKTQELKQLQEQLKSERDTLKQIQQQLTQMRDQLQRAVKDVRDASAADWQKLQELANIRDGGLAPLSQILLGNYWGEKIGQLEGFYRLVKPYIPESADKDEAADVPEPVLPNRILPLPRQPYPDFWVKNARVNWLIGGGEATISLQDITAQHAIINSATRFSLDVQNLPQLAAFNLKGDFAILQEMITNLSWQMEGFKLDELALGGGDNLLNIAAGILASSGSLKLVDDQVTQQAQVLLQQANITAVGNRYLQQLAELLDKQDKIPLNLSAAGLLSDPEVSVRSPLDKLIGDALLGEAKEKLAALETQLRGQLDAQLKEHLGGQENVLAALDAQDMELSSMQKNIEEMLNAELSNVTSGAKDRLKDLFKRESSE